MSVREKYKLAAIRDEIQRFESLTDARRFDESVNFFRENLEKPTLFGLETSLVRAALLQKIEIENLSKEEDKIFALYSLALTLNLTGGFPNRAIPLYEKHDAIAEKIGDDKSLSQSLGHHAKALRQTGRFRESEVVARRGLQVIRQRKDFLREAVNLYWLGMGLAHRGDAENSEIALSRSLRIFRAKFALQSEGVVNAFLAQRALWLEDWETALGCADQALEIGEALEADENHADLHGAVKILTAAARMKGEALIFLEDNFRVHVSTGESVDKKPPEGGTQNRGERFLLYALRRAREIEFVEEELPALRALALLEKRRGNFQGARDYLRRTWALAARGEFRLYDADSYNILAQIEAAENNREEAIEAARKAFRLSVCDGVPFAYRRGLEDAENVLRELGAEIPEIVFCDETRFETMVEIEINPKDEFGSP